MAKRKTITLTGDRALNRKLRRLSGKEAKKAIRKAARPALKQTVLPAAKQNAPVDTGALRRSIKVRALPRSRVRVGARVTTSEGLFKGDEFYAGFLELGYRARSGRKIAGRRFMRDAADSQRDAALRIYRKELRRIIFDLAR